MDEPGPRLSLSLNNVLPAAVGAGVSVALSWGVMSTKIDHLERANNAQDSVIATLQAGHAEMNASRSATSVEFSFVRRDLSSLESSVKELVREVREMRDVRIEPARGRR